MAFRPPLPAILVVALLLSLPSVAIGFYSDDYVLRTEVAHTVPSAPPAYDLYDFTGATPAENEARIASGTLPWWTSPGIRVHLLRPLASVLFALDVRVFGTAPLGYHLVSIAWYLALVGLVGTLLGRLLPRGTGNLATLIFAIDQAHVFPWGWASCRHMTIAATFSVASLLCLVRAREKSWRAGHWLSALLQALALTGGETALGGAAYALAYGVLGAPAQVPIRRRVALVAPMLAVTAVYLAVYAKAGAGAAHGGGYFSPLSEPDAFATAAARRLPVMLADATLGVPADLSSVVPAGPFLVAAGLGCLGVFALYRSTFPRVPPHARMALRWLVPGALLALLSVLGGFPGARLRLLPDVGFAALFGVLLWHGFVRVPQADGGAALWLRRALAGTFATIHLGLAPLLALLNTGLNAQIARKLEEVASDVAAIAVPGDRVFVLAGSDPMVSIYPPAVLLAWSTAWTRSCWSMASMAKGRQRFTRTGPSTVVIEPQGTTFLVGAFETLFRSSDEPLRVGDLVSQCGAGYRVLDMREGRPSEVELTLDVPLEDPHVHLLVWQEGHLRPMALPAVGDSLEIAWSPGPVGMF
ncbi:MAG: hypothetical protein WBY94_07435 [Polyangiaceae bacterium]